MRVVLLLGTCTWCRLQEDGLAVLQACPSACPELLSPAHPACTLPASGWAHMVPHHHGLFQ